MNASSRIPVACGTALALMAGAAASHFWSVRQTVILATSLQPDKPPVPSLHQAPIPPVESPAAPEKTSGNADVARRKEPRPAPAAPSAVDRRIEQLLGIIETNHAQISDLKNQLAETNRDIMEMQFQLDSHSQQFRPLQINDENHEDYTPSILPPVQNP